MDAHAHLLSLGWAGPGHALDARPYEQKGRRGLAYDPNAVRSTGGNGLVKPLLISQRQSRLGIGKKVHEPAAGNEWWLAGFEKALGNIGKSDSERTSGASTPESNTLSGKHSGLYGFFVKGNNMEGTIGEEQMKRTTRKRKNEEMIAKLEKSSESETRQSRDDPTADFQHVGAFLAAQDKDKKHRSRIEKPGVMDEFAQVGQFFEARSDRKKRKDHTTTDQAEEIDEESVTPSMETKEERRDRRRRRREGKAAQLAQATSADTLQYDSLSDEAMAKAVRKAERRRRKDEKEKLSRESK